MNSNEVRARFLAFFESKQHTVVPSAPLVPGNDPTLLFTNAGMVPFKDVFTGTEQRPYTRAASSQKCVRAGGKHNDLENVGYTARHHTFFEMLGNFSFGDYFKQDAIPWAWEFITSKDWLGIDPTRLLVTIYHTDEEAYALWKDVVGVPVERIVRIGDNKGAEYASDNFWTMGDTGPCGPCTEIFYDHGAHIPGGPPGSPDEDGDRWIEIWNVVFMQFERHADGRMTPLPAPSVDTGMGLERITALMQGTNDNYQIDSFRILIEAIARLAGQKPYDSASQKVIADHIRAASFLMLDGVLPGNEGRGYVLRRIMRRAIRHGYKLGLNDAFFYKLVEPLGRAMGQGYPELVDKRAWLEKTIRAEEDAFATTLDKGMKFVDLATDVRYRLFYQIARSVGGLVRAPGPRASEYFLEGYVDTNAGCEQIVVVQAPVNFSEFQVEVDLAELLENSSLQPAPQQIHYRVLGDALGQDVLSRVEGALSRAHAIFNARLQNRSEVSGTVDGRDVFKLYDTYGFPLDLTADIARERGLTLDVDGYEREMTAQRNRARAASGFKADAKLSYDGAATCFVGYDRLKAEATVVGLFREGQPVDALQAGEAGVVVLDSTPFYAESGGQVGDVGHITPHASRLTPHGFIVEDTLKIKGSVFGHHGRLAEGVLSVGDAVIAEVTESVRRASMRNHSATHLLHRALRDVLGDHVAQKGSLVDADKTRFDFSHPQPVTADELVEIENRVNRGILANVPVQAELMAFDDAIASGAMALFGEKYGDEVRVLSMGDYSTELCGGTHVTRTGDIGLFKIVSEGGVASGIRRVEAITGENALGYLRGLEFTLKTAADRLRGSREELVEKLDAQLERAKALEKEVAALKGKLAGAASGDLLSQARDIKGVKVLAAQVDGVSGNDLRDLQDQLKNKLGSGIVVLGAADGDKVSLIAGVTQDLVGRIKAGDIIKAVAAQVGGKGGGRPDMAQAGGTDASALPAALESVYSQVEGHLS